MKYGLPLPQAKASDTSQLARWQVPLVQRSALLYLSYMHSADVTQYHPLLAVGRRLCGKFGMYSKRSPQHSCTLASTPDPSSIDDQLEVLERFVVILYDRTSTEMEVNEARKHMFSQKGRPIDGLHTKRCCTVKYTQEFD